MVSQEASSQVLLVHRGNMAYRIPIKQQEVNIKDWQLICTLFFNR